MPPKRKAPVSVNKAQLAPRSIKVAKKKHETALEKSALAKSKEWFAKYTDSENKELIEPDGCQEFFTELDISLESIKPIIIGYKMNAERMGYITWKEWWEMMKALPIDDTSPKSFRIMVDQYEEKISTNQEEFKKLYIFTFNYAKSTGQKSMEIETACALWNLMLGTQYPIIHSFIRFLEEKKPVKVINKDQWSSMLDFCRTVPEDLQNYDSTASWPVLFDEYVEWRQSM